jgi:PAS domain S-box-containing protein
MDSPRPLRDGNSADEQLSSELPGPSSAEIESLLAEFSKIFAHSRQPQPAGIPDLQEQSKTTPEELPTLEDRYRVLVEQIPAVVFMAILDGGIGEAYVSPQIEQVLGFSREEWLDDPIRWYYQIHPDDRARWSVEAAQMFLTGTPLKAVYRVIARDGRVVWFHCEAKVVRRKDGQPWFIHGVGFDVTELKQTEQALQKQIAERERLQKLELERQIARTEQTESRLAAIVESSEDAIVGKNLEGIITSWNAAATRLFGYQTTEIVGKSVLVLIPPERQAEEVEILRKLRAGERIEHQETQRMTKDGLRVDVSLTISPIKDAKGQVIGASKIARDITQRRREEEKLRLVEKLAAAGRLAATIAHEINNPLEAVTNLLYLAHHSSEQEQVRDLLHKAEQELRRVSHITRQTLGFYRDTSASVSFKLSDAIDDVLALYSGKLSNKQINVCRQYRWDGEITAQRDEIVQVLANLISNALDASLPGGRIVLRVSRARDWKSRAERVRIAVADQGSGIEPKHLFMLFEPFFTTKKDVGTGLGLWVCHEIVKKHGGWIRVRSSTRAGRRGTVFSILLPARLQRLAPDSGLPVRAE